MWYYFKKYPLSLAVILAVVYLSFFKPPSIGLNNTPYMDKLVHVCMYLGLSGMLWLEFWKAHRKQEAPCWHGWIGACLCPVLFSGVMELLQEYCTTWRGGDWMDFAANAAGVLLATGGYYLIRPWLNRLVYR